MSSNIWHANFSNCKCADTRSCWFLDLLICAFQIELHYFNMKITTTWTFSCDSNMELGHHSIWQHVSLLSIHCGSGTSRSANHNTVGTMIVLPSLHANVVSRLSSPFPHPLFVLVVLFFFRMEILRSIGAACSGRMVPRTKGIGWGMGRGLKRDSKKLVGESSSFNRQWGNLKTAPMCSLFLLGFDRKWSAPKSGRHTATWLKCRVCTHRKRTYSVHHSPSVNHIHWLKTNAKQKTVLSQTPCQFRLTALPRFGLWQYKKTLRFAGMLHCLSKAPTYTYCSLYSHRERQLRTSFSFQDQSASHQWVSVLGAASWQLATVACLAQGQTKHAAFGERALLTPGFGPGGGEVTAVFERSVSQRVEPERDNQCINVSIKHMNGEFTVQLSSWP